MNATENTAVSQNNQQLKENAIYEIIKIFANYGFTIEEAERILYETLKKINQQTVRDVQ